MDNRTDEWNEALELMKKCWDLSERTKDPKLSRLAEIAGNCLENAFCGGDPDDLALSAIIAD